MTGPQHAEDYPHHFRPPHPWDTADVPTDEPAGVPVGPRPPRPWYQQVAGQWPLFVTLVGVTAGVLWAASGHWKRGSTLIGATFVLATVLRLVLPERLVGLLGVRGRAVDAACLALVGIGIVVLALTVPSQR